MRSLTLALIIGLLPLPALARDMSAFELQCREALNMGTREIQPGPQKGKLRDCIRDLAAAARHPKKTIADEARQQLRKDQALERAERLQTSTVSDQARVFDVNAVRQQYDQECREQLHIDEGVTVPPGPLLGQLLRCVERKVSIASREANAVRRRSSVEELKQEVHQRIQQREEGEFTEELRYQSTLRRERLNSQRPPSTTRFLNIRQSGRAQTNFSEAYIEGSTAQKRNQADQCRSVPARERAACIREALQSTEQ